METTTEKISIIESTIRQHGQRRQKQEQSDFIDTLDTEDLCSLIMERKNHPNFFTYFTYLLEGFSDSPEAHKKRLKVVLTLFKELPTITSNSVSNSLIKSVCNTFGRYTSADLVELCRFCINCIQKGSSADLSWKEVLPELLNILIQREYVEIDDDVLTGLVYKSQLIEAMHVMEWSPNIVTPIADMFTTMPMTNEEHTKIVKKLVPFMDKLLPQELPAFVYQLLKLCEKQNIRSIFLRLQNYFTIHIYSKDVIRNSDSESLDLIESANDEDAIQAESTILLHIYDSAFASIELKEYLTSLKGLSKSPEFILHPFQLTVLLTISTIGCYEERVFEILKMSINRMYLENERKGDSAWFRDMVPTPKELSTIFLRIIMNSLENRDLVLQGLVNLSFVLLSSGVPLGKEIVVSKIWDSANSIIIQLIKEKRDMANAIIQRLVQCICINQNVRQYIDCLHLLIRKYGLVMLDNQRCVEKLMEQLLVQPSPISIEILITIMPLMKLSLTLRDKLILFLRKALFSRPLEVRQIAVHGFLKIVRNIRFTNASALSHSSSSTSSFSSGASVFTQISLSRIRSSASQGPYSNEALCLEILNILRRCFDQHVDVQATLYEGLHEAVCVNADLGTPALELLLAHFDKFYETDEDILPPLQFSKIVKIKDAEAVLIESLGKLLYIIGSILSKVQELPDPCPIVKRGLNIFKLLSSKMAQSDLEHFQLNDGTDLSDVLPECQEKVLILKEAILVYEALIGYNISSWSSNSEDKSNTILRLFQAYNRLITFSKSASKGKKGDKSKKADTTSQTLNSTNKSGSKKTVIKLPDTILNLQVLSKMLTLLHQVAVPWTSLAESNSLKTNVELHRFFMKRTIDLINNIKSQKNIGSEQKRHNFSYCKKIAVTLFTRCVSRFKEFLEFDALTAILSIECFYALLQLIDTHYKHKWAHFLNIIDDNDKEENITEHLTIILKVYKDIFNTIDDSDIDAEVLKFLQLVINTIALLGSLIPMNSSFLPNEFLDWMKNFAAKKMITNKVVLNSFITFLFKFQVKLKSTTTLFKNIALKLGEVLGTVSDEEEMETVDELAIVTKDSAPIIILCLCNEVKHLLDDIDWIVLRLRSDYFVITYPGEETIERRREYLKSKERSTCCHICLIISIMTIISNVSVPLGTHSDAMVKILTHLFMTLNNTTKYFLARSTKINLAFQNACFDGVVKQAGKKLAPLVNKFILYIGEAHKGQDSPKKCKDANVQSAKVLRETRLIPKLVFEMEQFSKTVIQLSKKTKIDLAKYIGQGTSRDFRIIDLQSALGDRGSADDAENDVTMDTLDPLDSEHESEEEVLTPPAKKLKN